MVNIPNEKEEYLIVSRGLYFRPECKGYTGIKEEAGLYTKSFAEKYTDAEIIHIDNAPEYMPDTYTDLVVNHLKGKNKILKDENKRLREINDTLILLAYRTLWARFIWNDHNFGDLYSEIKKQVDELGFKTLDDANKFLESINQTLKESGGEYWKK